MKSNDQKEISEYVKYEEKLCFPTLDFDCIYQISQLISSSDSANSRNAIYHKLIILYADKKVNSSIRLRIYRKTKEHLSEISSPENYLCHLFKILKIQDKNTVIITLKLLDEFTQYFSLTLSAVHSVFRVLYDYNNDDEVLRQCCKTTVALVKNNEQICISIRRNIKQWVADPTVQEELKKTLIKCCLFSLKTIDDKIMLWDYFITMMSWNQGNAVGVALLNSLYQLCKGEPLLYEQMVEM